MKSTCRQVDVSLYPDFHLSVYCHCVQLFSHTSQSFFFFFVQLMARASASTATYGLKMKVDTSFTQCQGNLNLLDCNRQCGRTERLVIQSRHTHTNTLTLFSVFLLRITRTNTQCKHELAYTHTYTPQKYTELISGCFTLYAVTNGTHTHILTPRTISKWGRVCCSFIC